MSPPEIQTLPVAGSTELLGIAIGIVASALLNIGKGVQKLKVAVLRQGRGVLTPAHRKDFAVWTAGIAMTIATVPLYSLALSLTADTVSVTAANGAGLILLAVFARYVLNERLTPLRLTGCAVIVGGLAAFALSGGEAAAQSYDAGRARLGWLLAAASLGVCAAAATRRRSRGIALSVAAGTLLGTGAMLGDVALAASGGGMLEQLRTAWPYLAILHIAGALVMTQFAFFHAEGIVAVPIINTLMIVVPAFLSPVVFGATYGASQLASLAAICAGVVLLTASRPATAQPGPAA